MTDKDGGPAFPCDPDKFWSYKGEPNKEAMGMSLSDWFAGQALAGLLQNEDAVSQIQQAAREEGETYPAYTAAIAYTIADAMISERNKDAIIKFAYDGSVCQSLDATHEPASEATSWTRLGWRLWSTCCELLGPRRGS